MFKKRKWIIMAVLAMAIVVVVGVMAGAAYAKSGNSATTTQSDRQKVLAEKVAAILGLDTDTVEAALIQAQKEINAERSAEALQAAKSRIDQMVTAGKLTAEEAAQYKTWLESKPNIDVPGLRMKGESGRGGWGPGRCFDRCLPTGAGVANTNSAATN